MLRARDLRVRAHKLGGDLIVVADVPVAILVRLGVIMLRGQLHGRALAGKLAGK